MMRQRKKRRHRVDRQKYFSRFEESIQISLIKKDYLHNTSTGSKLTPKTENNEKAIGEKTSYHSDHEISRGHRQTNA